jgi:hypothetical protein
VWARFFASKGAGALAAAFFDVSLGAFLPNDFFAMYIG